MKHQKVKPGLRAKHGVGCVLLAIIGLVCPVFVAAQTAADSQPPPQSNEPNSAKPATESPAEQGSAGTRQDRNSASPKDDGGELDALLSGTESNQPDRNPNDSSTGPSDATESAETKPATGAQPDTDTAPQPYLETIPVITEEDKSKQRATTPAPKRGHVIEEILVTARRTEESLQDVPMAITVMDSKALAEKGISTASDLLTSVAGLSGSTTTTTGKPRYSMRGQGQITGAGEGDPGVLTYLAEVADFSPFIYDLQNVQVLKGPQGTLFGKNTTGGAILFTPARPTDTLTGYMNTRVGNYEAKNLDFALGGPLISNGLSIRLAGQRLRNDGYVLDITNNRRLDYTKRESYRLSLLATPFNSVENLTILQYDNQNEGGTPFVFAGYIDAPNTPFFRELGPLLERQNARGPRLVERDPSPAVTYERHRRQGIINSTSWNLNENWTLKNIISYRMARDESRQDYDGGPFPIITSSSPSPAIGRDLIPSKTLTEEVQAQFNVGRYKMIAGAYYEQIHQKRADILVELSAPGSTAALAIPYQIKFFSGAPSSRSVAGFAQGTVEDLFLQGLSLTTGLRYTQDEKHNFSGYEISGPGVPVGAPVRAPVANQLKTGAATGTLSANYRFMPDLMGYVTLRRGYKAGGFNLSSQADQTTYKPEYVWDIETGMKSLWSVGDWQVRLNANIFYDQYTNIQRLQFPPSIPPSAAITNAAAATIAGLDLDLTVAPTSWLDLGLQYTFLRTAYQDYTDPALGDLRDSIFPDTPAHQISFTPIFHLPVPQTWGTVSASATYFWQSKNAFFVPNKLNGNATNDQGVPGSLGDDFYTLDLRSDWRGIFGSTFSAAAYARNITDELYKVGAYNELNVSVIGVSNFLYGPPRTFGIELRYDF